MNTNKVTTARTAAQTRSAAKDGAVAKRRRRARYVNLPCAWCGFACYWGTDRVGRMTNTGENASDGTIGHLLAHTDGGTYAWDNTAPSCAACQTATGTRDMRGIVPAETCIPSERDAVAFLSSYVAPTRESVGGTREDRNAARMARIGF